MSLIRSTFIAGATIALTGAAPAQVLLYELSGLSTKDTFGSTLAAIGDLDGDGRTDFAVGAPEDDEYGSNAGRLVVCSGATGSTILELHGQANDHFARSVARVFDINGDGYGDIVVGAPGADANNGRAYVYGLPTGSLLAVKSWFEHEGFGHSVAGLGDISGDGVPDYGVETALTNLFGTPYAGCFYAYSGAGGFIASLPSGCDSKVHDAAGDVNGDGSSDYLFSESDMFRIPPEVVTLRSGTTHEVLDSLDEGPGSSYPRAFQGRDFDGDGNPEYLFTYWGPATKRIAQIRRLPAGGGAPEILFSIVVADAQFSHTGAIQQACCSDVTGDGTPDVLLGFPDASTPLGVSTGSVLAFDGLAPHGLLFRMDGDIPNGGFPRDLITLDDLDGDGAEEFAVGVTSTASSPGQVRVYSLPVPPAWVQFGAPLPGTTIPHLAGQGDPAPNGHVSLEVTTAPAAAATHLIVGLEIASLPFKGGVLGPTPDLVFGPFVTDATGALALHGQLPASVAPGLQLHFQCWLVDAGGPAGFSATNSLTAIVQR